MKSAMSRTVTAIQYLMLEPRCLPLCVTVGSFGNCELSLDHPYVSTVPILAGQSRIWGLCPAVPNSRFTIPIFFASGERGPANAHARN